MSSRELDAVIERVQATLASWGDDASLETMRKGWDDLFQNRTLEVGARSEPVDAGGVRAEWITPPGADESRVVLYLHGGGYVLGSIDSHRDLIERLAAASGSRALALDYRLAPEHLFPAAVDDATAAYRWLLAQGIAPERIAIAGDSAGGGLTLATLVALRDAGVPLPACGVPLSPWADMRCDAATYETKAGEDPMVQREMVGQMAALYLGEGGDPDAPLASPARADLSGLPPLLIQVGSREVLLDDARQVARRVREAGGSVDLEEWDGMIHVWQIFAAELDKGREAIGTLGAFIRKHTQ